MINTGAAGETVALNKLYIRLANGNALTAEVKVGTGIVTSGSSNDDDWEWGITGSPIVHAWSAEAACVSLSTSHITRER